MGELRVGRVVVGALHQALVDHLPLRIEFYEGYLRPMRLREGRVGAASFLAALSFLRREGDEWEAVMARAGRIAAEWTFDGLPNLQRYWVRRLPASWRARRALRLARELVAETIPASHATGTLSHGLGVLEIQGSAFCDARERARAPRCRFYGAALERFCGLLDMEVRVDWDGCRAMGHRSCSLHFRVPGLAPAAPARKADG
jgi:hypothetical protein